MCKVTLASICSGFHLPAYTVTYETFVFIFQLIFSVIIANFKPGIVLFILSGNFNTTQQLLIKKL